MPHRHAHRWLLLACIAGFCITRPAAAQDGELTIYRCTDAAGKLALQDSPCAKGQSQETRTVVQPKDPPPRAPSPTPVAPVVPAAPEPPRVVIANAPQPMYECVRPDDSTYTSDNGDGNPRYVSGWSWGGGGGGRRRGPVDYGGGFTPVNPPLVNIPQGTQQRSLPAQPQPSRRGFRPGGSYGYGSSMLVRDECHALPQAEVCARIRDRREEIRRRFFNAQETERATLDKEERGINARIASDCGGG